MKRLKTPKFSFSLILNFLISTLIPFVLVTLLIANLYKYNYTRDVFNLVDNSLVSISQNIYLYLSELDRATLTPYYNEDFFATLKHIKESSGRQSVLEQAQLENSLGYLMSFIRYTREDIAGSIIVAGGDCIYSTTNMVDSSVDPNYPFSEQEWYREALALKGRPLFVSPHSQDYYVPNTNPQVISVARAIVNLRTRQPLCVIKVDANTVIFEKVLQDIVFHVPSTVIVTDQSGHVVYSTLPVDGLDEADLSRDSVKINYGGQPYLKRSQPVRDYGWNVHVLLKESAVNSNIFYIYTTAFLLYLVGLLTALAFYFWRSRRQRPAGADPERQFQGPLHAGQPQRAEAHHRLRQLHRGDAGGADGAGVSDGGGAENLSIQGAAGADQPPFPVQHPQQLYRAEPDVHAKRAGIRDLFADPDAALQSGRGVHKHGGPGAGIFGKLLYAAEAALPETPGVPDSV